MGLSDEERMDKITVNANEIFKLACQIEIQLKKRDYTIGGNQEAIARICTDAKCIWHALYGQSSNSAYWILGGSVGGDIKIDAEDPLSAALRHMLEDAKDESEQDKTMRE